MKKYLFISSISASNPVNDNVFKTFIQKYNKSYNGGTITFYDIDVALRNYRVKSYKKDADAAATL